MRDTFKNQTGRLIRALTEATEMHQQIAQVVDQLRTVFTQGGKILVAGNGGSATLAQHLSDEMVGRYRMSRPPLPVIALSADTAVLTCIGNDFGFEQIFARQVEALGQKGDVLLLFSSSGRSPNILAAAEQARSQQITVISFCGEDGPLKSLADIAVVPNSTDPPRIQELNLHAIHLICEAFDPESSSG